MPKRRPAARSSLNSTSQQTLQYGFFYEEYEAFRSDHPGGANFAFVDGSVRFVDETIEKAVYQALATRDGGETIDSRSD